MAGLALGVVEKIFKTGLKIRKAVKTVQQNKNECTEIQSSVETVTEMLQCIKVETMGEMMHRPAFTRPLDALAASMEAALELITDCQQKSALLHLLGAEDMAKKLCRVQYDIQRKLTAVILATSFLNLEINVWVINTLRSVSAHLQPLLPQGSGDVNSYDRNLSAIEMRPGVSNYTTGNAVPYASSSRLAEFNWSERESTLHFSSEEHISKDGHAFILKQEIIIKVAMRCDKCRSKEMALAAALDGVDSVAISGECRDKLVVVSQGVDSVKLINALRKKIGFADLLQLGSVSASRSNRELPRQRFRDLSSGSSSDSDDDNDEDPRPSSSKGKGKQCLEVARPHVAIRPGGSSAKGFLGHLCSRFCFANHE